MIIKDPRKFHWVFNSPYEIYASGRWTGTRTDPAWQKRAAGWAEQNSSVFRGEYRPDKDPAVSLVNELFFLHLTVRETSPEINHALDSLRNMKNTDLYSGETLPDIPFEIENAENFTAHAWLFNSAVFGLAEDSLWWKFAETEGKKLKTAGRNAGSCSLYNYLRGTLIIPGAEKVNGVPEAMLRLSERQDASGFIKSIAPWQLYNLMAHSAHPTALKILENIEKPLLKLQNSDSSWGEGAQKPLATFLMAHGLQNRGFL